MDSWSRRTRWAFNASWLAAHCLGEQRIAPLTNRVRARVRREAGPPQDLAPLTRVRNLSEAEFRSEFLAKNRPVVMDGAARNWACMSWTPASIAREHGSDEVLLIQADVSEMNKPSRAPRPTTLADIAREMAEGGTDYARFNPLLQRHPELRDALDPAWLEAHTNRVKTGVSYQLFMGGAGTTTAVHSAISNNLFVQIHGVKRWRIYPTENNPLLHPPVLRAPYFFSRLDPGELTDDVRQLRGFEVELHPGDILFLPAFYWHWVHNETPTIGVGFRWFAPSNIWRASKTQLLLTALATNPPAWKTRAHRHDFTRIFGQTKRTGAEGQ